MEDKEFAGEISERAFRDVQQYSWAKRAAKKLEFIVKESLSIVNNKERAYG